MISKLTLEDIYVGQRIKMKKKITAELIKAFSDLTGDYHPLHTDSEYAAKNGFVNILSQGFLAVSFLSYIVGMKLPGENALILSQESKFLKPVYIDEEIDFVCEVAKIDTRFSTFLLNYAVLLPNGKKAITGNVHIKIRPVAAS